MTSPSSASWPWIALSVVITLIVTTWLQRRFRRLPPGPYPLPIIGNILDMPRKNLAREFLELSNKYGEVMYLNVLGQSIVALGSYRAACDLLDKRSANYSDRPHSVMISLVGFGWLFVLMNYGSEWRQHRRAFHRQMNAEVIVRYEPIQLDVARTLLRNVLGSPKDMVSHLNFAFAATTMRIAYGIELHEPSSKYFKMVEQIAHVGQEITVPGRYLVEAIPWLRFLPLWFPGAGFKRYAAEAKRDILFTVDHLFNTAKAAMDDGLVKDSIVTRLLDFNTEEGTTEQEVCRGVTASTYAAGAETTNASMSAFILAMAMYPEVQKKAQAELDAEVGPNRLPEFGDRHSLPYISALVKELLRWHIVAPVGVPHCVASDDEYNGYLIPAGATILANVWAISRDTATFPDPENFIPERFLDQSGQLDVEGKDPADFAFGFGRRICPGLHFAESSLFIVCASILWAFDISPPVDEKGVPVQVEHRMSTNVLVSEVQVPECTIQPRSLQAERVVRETSPAT